MSERKIFSFDRREGEWAVCVSDDDVVVSVPLTSIDGLAPRDVFSARIEGDTLVEITPMPDERDRRRAENRKRLHALAKRSDK